MHRSRRDNQRGHRTDSQRFHDSAPTVRPSRHQTVWQPGGTATDRETLQAQNDSQEAAAVLDGLSLTSADRARGGGGSANEAPQPIARPRNIPEGLPV